ncbi:MAG: type I-U CRISPR-associated protein Csb2 [Verrucomicrobia bacterium]|nr:type I-U CRISPR-associated protein Csb2 [Verrucomicrobiota bacterium]
MIILSIRFLTGRFHATQWGRHVNEGVPEWPPSPWRILRSFVATWKAKCPNIGDDLAERILRKLAEMPDFALPSASVAHTRHYMPWDKKEPGHTTLVFDTFVVVPSASDVLVCWPDGTLLMEERAVLVDWLHHVGYLGRAESWCEMRLLDDCEAEKRVSEINCRQLGSRTLDKNTEIVRVLCPDPASAFSSVSEISQANSKIAHYDPDWRLCGETLWLHAEKWAEAPGSRWVRYSRNADCFKVTSAPKRTRSKQVRPQMLRFALDSTVLPLVTETLPVAEAARRNLMGILGRQLEHRDGVRGMSKVFSGKTSEGLVLETHDHAYYLPTDEDGDGRLDHLTIVAGEGFGPDELCALNALREIKSKERTDSGHPLGVLLLGMGMLGEDFTHGPTQCSAVWNTVTPYLCHRHPKTRGSKRDSPEELSSHVAFTTARLREDIARLIERRADFADITLDQIMIEPLEENGVFRLGARRHRPIEFQRFRQKHGDDGGKRLSGAFRITFPREIPGPISLGHSSHFGMGLCFPQ